jgi:hypothetical protein
MRRISRRAAIVAGVVLIAFGTVKPAVAGRLAAEEIAQLCAAADDSAHCGRLVEETLLKRLPGLATREGSTLKVNLYPSGVATLNDTETLYGGRSYSLWDFLDPINAVVLYTTDHDQVTFTVLQRASGRKAELPTEPVVSPDRQRLATADFCAERCTNELATWRIGADGVRKESVWKPKASWSDAGVKWLDAETLVIEYTAAGGDKPARLERRLGEPGWTRP